MDEEYGTRGISTSDDHMADVWQFYLRRATFNPHFARALGFVRWNRGRPAERDRSLRDR